jgi:hypothetical protein
VSTHQTAWHADDEDLATYLGGGTSPLVAASLETHLLGCARCRARLAELTDEAARSAAWERLADAIDHPSRGPWLLRSVVATPAMLQAALVSLTLVGLVPLVAALFVSGDAGLVALLVLAPLAPVAAVALAYRGSADPSGEISLATPAAGLRLVALRAVVVTAAALPLAFVALLVIGHWVDDLPVSVAFAWCLPGLALAALVLAAGTTRLDPVMVAVATSAAWALLVTTVVTSHRSLHPEAFADAVAGLPVQSLALAVAVAAVACTVVRRDAVAYRRTA